MAELWKKPGDSIDRMLRKFKRKVKEEGIIDEMKKREFYEKPSETRKRTERAAERRNRARRADEW